MRRSPKPTAAGFDLVGLEVGGERVRELTAGDSYTEDVPDAELRAALDRGYLSAADP